MSEGNVKSVIEALLFTSDKPIMLEQFKNVLGNMQTDEVRGVIEELKKEYAALNRGIQVTEIAGGFQMITSPNFAPFIKKFYKQRKVERLSKPAMETLGMIAYKQPVTKQEIESLRNVNADGVVQSLMSKGLVRVVGRRKAPGRPFVYGTTRQFLQYFGLKSLEELPKIENFQAVLPPQEVEQNLTEESDVAKEPARAN